jgi:parvulin-like peptidyl-prolyl isomerase
MRKHSNDIMRTIVLFFIALSMLTSAANADQAIAARVNNAIITQRDLDEEIDRLLPSISYHGNVTDERKSELREKALDALVVRELQYQDAVRSGLTPDKKRVKARLTKVKDSFATKKEYESALKEAGINEDQLRERFNREDMIAGIIEKTIVDRSHATDADLQAYYEANINKYRQPESARVRMISTKDDKKLSIILAALRKGEDFGRVAALNSEDKYRVMGGDLGVVHKGSLLPEIEKAVFSLKPGEISDGIRIDGIWYVVGVEERTPERQLALEDVKEKLKRELERRRANELTENWVSALKSKAVIDVTAQQKSNLP